MSNPNLCIHCGYPIDIATLNSPASLICPNCLKPLSQTAEKLVKEGIDPDLIDPFYSDDELKEIGCIGYHIDEMEGLVGRNLVTDEVFQIVSNEQNERLKDLNRLGRAERAIQMAQQCSVSSRFRPLSINWAEAACRLAPDRLDFWEKAIHFATQHEALETATRLCLDATQTYGHSELVGRLTVIENLIRKKEQTDFTRSQLQSARHSLSSGDYTTAAESAKSIIKLNPYSNEAWDLLTTALEKSGLYREALKAISDCQNQFSGRIPMEQMGRADRIKKLLDNSVNPAAPMTTPTSVSQYKSRLGPLGPTFEKENLAPSPSVNPDIAHETIPNAPRFTWTSVAAEFLEEQWQKLIMALAVVLIVVSTTVGAAILLGDLLWRPEGKVLLAVAYTSLFAASARGLIRWGAERAGRILSLTTLLMLPVDFALVGEMPVFATNSTIGFGVLSISLIAFALIGKKLWPALNVPGGQRTFLAFLALGLIDALTPRNAPFNWGFISMVLTSAIFLASINWIHLKRVASTPPFEILSLLVFAFLWGVVRIGGSVLHIGPSLYAIPVIFAGIASIRIAEGFTDRAEKAARFIGFILTTCAFALALAHPPGRSILYTGNTLATALLGLCLFVKCLHRERLPAYLYAAFGACVLCYFGSYDFLRDLISSIETSAAAVLGYNKKLPLAYRAINGLVFNSLLIILARYFRTVWEDKRLQLHCHYIGLPLAIGSCILGSTEPWAALFTLGGYTIGFAVIAWLYELPLMVYLACASSAGLFVNIGNIANLSLVNTLLGLSFLNIGYLMTARIMLLKSVPNSYRRPLIRFGLLISTVVTVLTSIIALNGLSEQSWPIVATFGMTAACFGLLEIEPELAIFKLAYFATASLATCLMTGIWVGTSAVIPISSLGFALTLGLLANIFVLTSRLMKNHESRTSHYSNPFWQVGLFMASDGMAIAISRYFDGPLSATEFILESAIYILCPLACVPVLLRLTNRESPLVVMAYGSVISSIASIINLTLGLNEFMGHTSNGFTVAVAIAVAGFLITIVGERIRKSVTESFKVYDTPLRLGSIASTASAFILAGSQLYISNFASPEYGSLTVICTLNAIVLCLLSRQIQVATLPALSIISTWLATQSLCLRIYSNGMTTPINSLTIGWLSLNSSLFFWIILWLKRSHIRIGLADIWVTAIRNLSPIIASIGIATAFYATLIGNEPFVLIMSSFIIAASGLILSAIQERSQTRVYLSISAFALAIVQILLHLYPETYLSSKTLAAISTLLATFCWIMEFQIKKRLNSIAELFCAPLSNTSAILSFSSILFTGSAIYLADFSHPEYALFAGLSILSTINFIILSRFNTFEILRSLSLFSAWIGTQFMVLSYLSLNSFAPLNSHTIGSLTLSSSLFYWITILLRFKTERLSLPEIWTSAIRSVGLLIAIIVLSLSGIVTFFDNPQTAFISASILITGTGLICAAVLERSHLRAYLGITAFIMSAGQLFLHFHPGISPTNTEIAFLSISLSIICWLAEWGIKRKSDQIQSIFSQPLANSTLFLASIASMISWNAPVPMLLSAIPFILMIRIKPCLEWLYIALTVIVISAFSSLNRFPNIIWWKESAIGLSYIFSLTGILLYFKGPKLCRALNLPELRLFQPFYHAALLMGVGAYAILAWSISLGQSWFISPWLHFASAFLILVFATVHPHSIWNHLYAGLTTLGLFSVCGNTLEHPFHMITFSLAAASTSLFWKLVEIALKRWNNPESQSGGSQALTLFHNQMNQWSLGLGLTGIIPVSFLTILGVASACSDISMKLPEFDLWLQGLISLILIMIVARIEIGNSATSMNAHYIFASLNTLCLWWICLINLSQFSKYGVRPYQILPLATVIQALFRSIKSRSQINQSQLSLITSASVGTWIAIIMTAGRIGLSTTITLWISTIIFVRSAITSRRSFDTALACLGVIFTFMATSLDYWVPSIPWLTEDQQPFMALATGQILAASLFAYCSRWMARQENQKQCKLLDSFSLFSCELTTAAIIAVLWVDRISPTLSILCIGLILWKCTILTIIAIRWNSTALAYLTQISVFLGFLIYRLAFPNPALGDVTILLLFAAIELGISEVLDRFHQSLFAKPALYASTILPLIAISIASLDGFTSDRMLFMSCATASFYAILCGRTGLRIFGSASAVLYNAFLWIYWYRSGWELAESPQFYLIPVGITSILFSQAYRRELGNQSTNTIRGLGLSLIYVSLGAPILQDGSLVAWAVLLIASLTSIFLGIGLKSQVFLWLGLAGFILDISYQLGRFTLDNAIARWAIMLVIGITLLLFVAISEKKAWLGRIRTYIGQVRDWE